MATPDGGRSCEWHFHVLSWTFWSRLDGNEYHADKDEGELTFIFQFVCTCGYPHWYSTPVYMWTLVNAQCGQVSASVCVLWASLSGSILGYWSHSFPSSPFFFFSTRLPLSSVCFSHVSSHWLAGARARAPWREPLMAEELCTGWFRIIAGTVDGTPFLTSILMTSQHREEDVSLN